MMAAQEGSESEELRLEAARNLARKRSKPLHQQDHQVLADWRSVSSSPSPRVPRGNNSNPSDSSFTILKLQYDLSCKAYIVFHSDFLISFLDDLQRRYNHTWSLVWKNTKRPATRKDALTIRLLPLAIIFKHKWLISVIHTLIIHSVD